MTVENNAAIINNLEKQKTLFSKMLEVSSRQLTLVQSTRGNLDVESLNRMLAERQNLIERIDALKQELPQKGVDTGLTRLGDLFREMLELMREIDRQDQASREIVQSEMSDVKDRLKKTRVKKKAANAYAGYQSSVEGHFFDQRK